MKSFFFNQEMSSGRFYYRYFTDFTIIGELVAVW